MIINHIQDNYMYICNYMFLLLIIFFSLRKFKIWSGWFDQNEELNETCMDKANNENISNYLQPNLRKLKAGYRKIVVGLKLFFNFY